VFFSAAEPKGPVSQGWLRVSHRKLDPKLSVPYRPYHTHDERQTLTPGQIYEVDVEIWPGSLALPPGYRLDRDDDEERFERPGEGEPDDAGFFLHDDPVDRAPAIFGGTHKVHTGPGRESYLLLPVLES